jgi:hypothetical protein
VAANQGEGFGRVGGIALVLRRGSASSQIAWSG